MFKKIYNKLFRKKTRGAAYAKLSDGTIAASGFTLSPEDFRRQFEAAYPDAAKFLAAIRVCPDANDAFMLAGSFVSEGFLGAKGLSASYADDIELRQRSIDISTRFGDPLQVNLYRAYIIFLYMKYGVAEEGVSVDEIFDKHDFTRERKYKYPEGPIKL